jgi:hypothetical protein
MKTETQLKQLAAWDQIEADIVHCFDHLSDDELLMIVEQTEGFNIAATCLVAPLAIKSLAFTVLYEHRRRNGGFGRDESNPVSDQTPSL